MRQDIICFLSLVLFGCMTLAAQDSSDDDPGDFSKSVIITIKGMACQEGCADAISANLKKVPGVTAVAVSFASGKAVIDFKNNEVAIDTLKEVITKTKVKEYVYTIKEVELLADN